MSLGMDHRFVVHTPLMWRDKAATWALARKLRRRGLGGADRRGDAQLLSRRPHPAPRLGPWLRLYNARPACCVGPVGKRLPRRRHHELRRQDDGGAVSYAVKEIFYTLQGEGAQTGRPSVFCRFAGCNLWSGREADRARAVCSFCAHRFRRPRRAARVAVIRAPETLAGEGRIAVAQRRARAVCRLGTGGEPLLQLDPPLIAALHRRAKFEIAVETNGTVAPPDGDRLALRQPESRRSAGARQGRHELKIVVPQSGARPARFCPPRLCPLFAAADGRARPRPQRTELAMAFCQAHPRWQLSLQTHKLIGFRLKAAACRTLARRRVCRRCPLELQRRRGWR